jgi:hypothetical protein
MRQAKHAQWRQSRQRHLTFHCGSANAAQISSPISCASRAFASAECNKPLERAASSSVSAAMPAAAPSPAAAAALGLVADALALELLRVAVARVLLALTAV